MCIDCPIRRRCLNDALVNGSVGIWAGTTTIERKAMKRRAARARRIARRRAAMEMAGGAR
jgi:WhiB family redox-sensing transcriptional regulator